MSALCSIIFLCISFTACGNSPNRFNPGTPSAPAEVTVTAGDGQITLEWSAVGNAAAYNVFYSTSPGVSKSNGTKISNITSLSTVVSGLQNGTTYYFVVTSVNSRGESAASNEVPTSPSPLAPFGQSNLTGDWRFNILVAGASNGWMRGSLHIDGQGAVSFTSFLDNSGGTSAPADLFATSMAITADGAVSQTDSETSFKGFILDDHLYRDILVGTSSWRGGTSHFIAVLLKQRGNSFVPDDVQGSGSYILPNGSSVSGTGAKYFIYNQISTDGSTQEWEFAFGKLSQNAEVSYTTFKTSSSPNPTIPGNHSKVTQLLIDTDGTVTETPYVNPVTGLPVQPQPVAYVKGFMSSDKTVIVGTPRDTGESKHFLRIYQIINLTSKDTYDSQFSSSPRYYTLSDLAGTYDLERFTAGATGPATSSAYGSMVIGSSGAAFFPTYFNDEGTNAVSPASIGLAITSGWTSVSAFGAGELTSSDTSLFGKLSYYKNLAVFTRKEQDGRPSLFIGMKHPQ